MIITPCAVDLGLFPHRVLITMVMASLLRVAKELTDWEDWRTLWGRRGDTDPAATSVFPGKTTETP